MAEGTANGNRGQLPYQITTPLMSWKKELKVLLVDPSTTCTLIGRAYLTNYGVKTEAVENAHLAIAMLHTGSSFDLILIAMHMREMNGAQFARQLRGMGVQTRLLGMVTMFRGNEKEDFLAAGGDGFIEKPLHPSKFIPILQDLDNSQE